MALTHQQLLAATGASFFGMGKNNSAVCRALAETDLERFVDDALRQGMAGLIYRYLIENDIPQRLPRRLFTHLRKAYLATAAANVARLGDLAEILSQTERNEIPAVVLKGMGLLETVYGDPGLRPMEDIDLWVMPEHFRQMADTLRRLGYVTDPLYRTTLRKGRTVLDLRTHLVDADRIRSRRQLMGIDPSVVFDAAVAVPIDGCNARVLAAADQVLFLVIHALKHDISRMIWLVDILGAIRFWEEKEWRELNVRAGLWRQERSRVWIFYLMERLFGICLSPEGSSAKSKSAPGALEGYALRQRVRKKALPPWSSLVLFSTAKGLGGRLRYVFETLFPRPEILGQVFSHRPDLSPRELYLHRMLQLVKIPFQRFR